MLAQIKSAVFIFILIFVGVAVVSLLNLDMSAREIVRSTERPSNWQPHFNMGIGSFQDIGLPSSDSTISIPVFEPKQNTAGNNSLTDRIGLPINIGIKYEAGSKNHVVATEANFTEMIALDHNTQIGPASYSRWELDQSIAYRHPFYPTRARVGLGMSLRRSGFYRISTGHVIDSVMPRIFFGLGENTAWQLDVSYAKALKTYLRYDNGVGFGLGQISKSQALVSDAHLSISKKLYPAVWLVLDFQQEASRISISDIEEYEEFGLVVSSRGSKSRSYYINTRMVTLGFKKSF